MTKKSAERKCPGYRSFLNAVLLAVNELGGSATNEEIVDKVIELRKLPDEIVNEEHSNLMTELEYQLAWARTYLRNAGFLDSSKRGVWSLTAKGAETAKSGGLDEKAIVRQVNNAMRLKRESKKSRGCATEREDEEQKEESRPWMERLSDILHAMDPYAFEKLSQRLLRECGFSDVKVTKKSGDGGIDGTGKLRLQGIFSFNVAFQCKRYKNQVGAGEIRDFRGSLDNNIEKGVLITTGSFSKAAREEASAPGKQHIDLMDGEEFMQKLAECGIGLKECIDYEIDESYFNSLK